MKIYFAVVKSHPLAKMLLTQRGQGRPPCRRTACQTSLFSTEPRPSRELRLCLPFVGNSLMPRPALISRVTTERPLTRSAPAASVRKKKTRINMPQLINTAADYNTWRVLRLEHSPLCPSCTTAVTVTLLECGGSLAVQHICLTDSR